MKYDLVKYLCVNGADAGLSDGNGKKSILSQPAKDGEAEIVKILLSKGAAPDISDAKGLTPIYYAAVNKHFDIVKILCERKADVRILDRKRVSVLSKVCSDGDLDFVKLLLRGRINPSEGDSLKVSIELYHQDITRELLNAGTNVDKVSALIFHFSNFIKVAHIFE